MLPENTVIKGNGVFSDKLNHPEKLYNKLMQKMSMFNYS